MLRSFALALVIFQQLAACAATPAASVVLSHDKYYSPKKPGRVKSCMPWPC
jgi:hypothetical protein